LAEKNLQLESALAAAREENTKANKPELMTIQQLLEEIRLRAAKNADRKAGEGRNYARIHEDNPTDSASYPHTNNERLLSTGITPFINYERTYNSHNTSIINNEGAKKEVLNPPISNDRTKYANEGTIAFPTKEQLLHVAQVLNEDAVYKALKSKGMFRVTNDGVLRMARVLLLLCRDEQLPYATIRKEAKMTNSGVQKMLASMKDRGLIKRTGFQALALTQEAIQILTTALRLLYQE
jgi:hypothetical protein